MVSASHDERLLGFDVLKRDANSVVGRATDAKDNAPVLVRRLVRSRRFDSALRRLLIAEVAYTAQLECARCPRAELSRLDDGEFVLYYDHPEGVELDRVLDLLEGSRRALTPLAAMALVSEVIHASGHITRLPPPPVDGTVARGHGEIAPRSVLLGIDGFGRLYETRFACAGFRSTMSAAAQFCRAPELQSGPHPATPAGDVYAVGALLGLMLFGPSALLGENSDTPPRAIRRAEELARGAVPRPLVESLLRAVASTPDQRFESVETMRLALKGVVPIEFGEWRKAIEGMAALAELLSTERDLKELPPEIFDRYPVITRPLQGPETEKKPTLEVQPEMETAVEAALADALSGGSQVIPLRRTRRTQPPEVGSAPDEAATGNVVTLDRVSAPPPGPANAPPAPTEHVPPSAPRDPAPVPPTSARRVSTAPRRSAPPPPASRAPAPPPFGDTIRDRLPAFEPRPRAPSRVPMSPPAADTTPDRTPELPITAPAPAPAPAADAAREMIARAETIRARSTSQLPLMPPADHLLALLGHLPNTEPSPSPPPEPAQAKRPPAPPAEPAMPSAPASELPLYDIEANVPRTPSTPTPATKVARPPPAVTPIPSPSIAAPVRSAPAATGSAPAATASSAKPIAAAAPPPEPAAGPAPVPAVAPNGRRSSATWIIAAAAVMVLAAIGLVLHQRTPSHAPTEVAPLTPTIRSRPAPREAPAAPVAPSVVEIPEPAPPVPIRAAPDPRAAPGTNPAREARRKPAPSVPPPAAPTPEPTRVAAPAAEPAPPPEKVVPEPPRTGRLVINVLPWGNVFVDGRSVGYPPVVLEDLTPGDHRLEIRREGYEPIEQSISVRAGEEKRVHLHLSRSVSP